MTGAAEAHFDEVAELQEQQALAVAQAGAELPGPWQRTCGAAGPYCIAVPTRRQPGRLQVLTCTRPENHGGPFHQAANHHAVVLASWGRDGSPKYPTLRTEGSDSGSDVRV